MTAQDDLARLRSIALEAGALQLAERDRLRSIDYKSATDMVTDLDMRVEKLLVARFAEAFPEDGLKAEEGSARVGESGRVWHIDPLDGTTNYVHGHPFFAVSLGRADGERPDLAAVYAPELDELYLASAGGGATLERPQRGESRPLTVREPVALERALLATGFPYVRDEIAARNCDLMKTFLLRRCHGVRRGGSAAIDLCHIAAGRLDGYWELKLNTWDIAAGVLVAQEAGAVVSDFTGAAECLHARHVLAAAPGLHPEMLSLIQEEIHDLL
jgi:myo-inositol-1(or 4)-monophosphatase